jgi:hypothetical protein
MTQNFFEKDAIFEAIKREDFVKKVKKALPWVIGAAVFVLLSTVGWVFYQHKQDAYLFEKEQEFVLLLNHVRKEQWREVEKDVKRSFPTDQDQTRGFAYLAKLYHLAALQDEMRVLPSQLTQTNLNEMYQSLQTPLTPGANFVFSLSQTFLALDFPQFFSSPSDSLRDIAFPQHSFYEAGLMLAALTAYAQGQPHLNNIFSVWEEKAKSQFQWMAAYCSIGSCVASEL